MIDKTNNKVIFFYPSKIVGGAELLFYRMAKRLANKGIEVSYIDYENGFIANEIRKNKENIKIIKYTLLSFYKLDKESTIIVPMSFLFAISSFFRGDFKVILWSILSKGLEYTIKSLQRYPLFRTKLPDFSNPIRKFIDLKGLYFMDLDNFYYQNKIFDLKLDKVSYLPIPCPEKNNEKSFSNLKSDINIGWLGRLSTEKKYCVENIIDNCNLYLEKKLDERIIFHVIGDGDYMNYLKNLPINDRLKIIFLNTLTGNDLDNYLLENVDIMFAMGTSALEASALKIPTILMDHSLIPFNIKNKFRFLYESEGYSLGNSYEEGLTNPSHSFEEIIEKIKSLECLQEEMEKCYSYYKENHSEEQITEKLISILNKNELTNSDIRNTIFGRYGFLQRLVFIYSYIRSL